MNFFNLFISGLLLFSVSAEANEDMSMLGNDPGITYMDDVDMDFSNMDKRDAFLTEPDTTVPMLQRKSAEGEAYTSPISNDEKDVSSTQIPPMAKKDSGKGATLSKNATLTDTLQQQEKETMSVIPLPDVSGTWVDKLAQSIPSHSGENEQENMQSLSPEASSGDHALQNIVDSSLRTTSRSNASVFDISGIMLRMNLAQAEKAMMTRGFKLISQKLEIPNFIKWRNEEKCRGNGVVGYERLMNCVVEIAKKNNHQYVERAKFSKFSTKEEIEIKLTSNFTGNKIYFVSYKSSSGRIIGSGAKAAYLRNIKVFDFWKKVNQKYGAPDNKDEVTWGLGGNKPYMKASTGFLLLEDPMLRELDYTRMSREDQRFMNTDLYSF